MRPAAFLNPVGWPHSEPVSFASVGLDYRAGERVESCPLSGSYNKMFREVGGTNFLETVKEAVCLELSIR